MALDMHRAGRSAKAGLRALGQFVWPARSILSNERHGGDGPVPYEAFGKLTFLNGQGCHGCAVPMEPSLIDEPLCGACLAKPPIWDAARAALAYDEASRPAILELKHAGKRDGLSAMGTWLASAGADLLAETDALVPVPLHYRRLAQRGFNQAVWLAQATARSVGKPVLVDAVVRARQTPSQGGLTGRQRRLNVAGAFGIRERRRSAIEGATLTLVDDVYTTGSTLSACAKTLKRAGAAKVNILVLARVVRPSDITI
ncbi:MAG: ComF family protein [Pseudomonadota bacterium]